MQLTAKLVENFAGVFLSGMYDEPRPTPQFHREGWELYCSNAIQAALCAPREHAKSTAFTHDFALAASLFRAETYTILVSSTEEMAIEHLGDIAKELRENEDLIAEFEISGFVVDAKTDIIVKCRDGHQFRIVARGSGQKMRGRKWRGRRPGLIICDDLEDDEQVESPERRIKFRRWFFRALKPALRDGGKIRVHGTIIHDDSLLSRLMKDRTWASLFYKAHDEFDDFSNILWPEKFPEARLRSMQDSFVAQQDAAGYSQEYLNDPLDHSDAFLKKDDFIEMQDADYASPKIIFAGADFAVSRLDKANRTSFTVAGKDILNLVHYIGQHVGRWDTAHWIDELFIIQLRYRPQIFFVEDGVIWKAVWPTIQKEMQKRDIYINFEPIPSIKDKATRARPFQKRMRAGGCRFDKRAEWYYGFEQELLRFTGVAAATLDDQFDSAALICRGLDLFREIDEDDFFSDEDLSFREQQSRARSQHNQKEPGFRTGYQ